MLIRCPTNECRDGVRLEFTLIYSQNTKRYSIFVGGKELKLDYLGLRPTADLTRRFTQGLSRVMHHLQPCQGSDTDLSQLPGLECKIMESKKVSLFTHEYIGQAQRVKRFFSKKCLGVLAITCEVENKICGQCSNDLYQVRMNYQKKVALARGRVAEQAIAAVLATKNNTEKDDN